LVLDSGDLLFPRLGPTLSPRQGNQLRLKARMIVNAFNHTGCDAVAVGETDLALGSRFLLKMAEEAHFPFVSSNLVDRETRKSLFKPYVVRELDGLKIGIIALISRDVFPTGGNQALKEFHLQDPSLTAERMVRELRDQTDLIILLSHMGHREDRRFAQRVKGIDIIVGGHTGAALYNPAVLNETLILHNSAHGKTLGSIEIDFSADKSSFANADVIKSLRETLVAVEKRIRSLEAEKPSTRRQEALESTMEYRGAVKKRLKACHQKNPFRNRITRLHDRIPSDPHVHALVEQYKGKSAGSGKDKGCGPASKKTR
jgi:2',3'-cyclic-nucleotide 2'-phosphodiesterase (5'-nucleotidase family)